MGVKDKVEVLEEEMASLEEAVKDKRRTQHRPQKENTKEEQGPQAFNADFKSLTALLWQSNGERPTGPTRRNKNASGPRQRLTARLERKAQLQRRRRQRHWT